MQTHPIKPLELALTREDLTNKLVNNDVVSIDLKDGTVAMVYDEPYALIQRFVVKTIKPGVSEVVHAQYIYEDEQRYKMALCACTLLHGIAFPELKV